MAQTRTLSDVGWVVREESDAVKERRETSVRVSAIRQKHYGEAAPRRVGAAPPFPSFVQSYSTLLPGLAGGQLVCGWRRTWELHPSEDLSELHRLLVSVAMQKYHCRQMRSWRGSLPRLLLDERVSLGTFRFGTCIDTGNSRAGGHGAFSVSLSSFLRRLIC